MDARKGKREGEGNSTRPLLAARPLLYLKATGDESEVNHKTTRVRVSVRCRSCREFIVMINSDEFKNLLV